MQKEDGDTQLLGTAGDEEEVQGVRGRAGYGGELFREMVRAYEDYREEKEFRRLQRYGALKSRGRFGSEEELFESLYLDR